MSGKDQGNPEELFVRLFAQHERHLRAFVRSTGLDWNAVDEVVQTVSLVMWRKWENFDPDSNFMSWARVIARFEVLKFRRTMARDRHVFTDDLMELLADASEELDSQTPLEKYRVALEACLETLPARSRGLINAAYEENRSIRDLAKDEGKSATALYKALNRIREKLQECVEGRLGKTAPGHF
jgi:RNA polymerase sigma-70 factor (ECF subfamily)